MNKKCNYMAFTPEETEKGLANDLITYLLKFNKESESYYNDIHITTDSYCTIVEWETVPYDHCFGGKFEYIDEDEEVVKNLELPDGHIEFVPVKDADNYLADWLTDHPEWTKNKYGRWVEITPDLPEVDSGPSDNDLNELYE